MPVLPSSPSSARLLPALCALLALLNLACGSGRLTGCSKDRDCPFPQTCEGSVCVNSGCGVGAPTCVDDSACQTGQRCSAGCCVAGNPGSCTHDADCEGRTGTPVCDTASASCVPCLINSDCGAGRLCQNKTCVGQPGCYSTPDCKDPAKPLCDVAARTCVECLTAGDCGDASKPNCDATHTCAGNKRCTGDGDCKKPTPRCEGASGACVTCLGNADCTSGFVCGPQHTCVVPSASTCTTDADCASNLDAPHCKPGTATTPGLCVACTLPEHCAPGNTCAPDLTCKPQTCAKDADCTNPASPRCELVSKACVECLGGGDCPGGGTCQADHTCKAPAATCKKDDDCASDVSAPHCQIVSGGANQCVACRNAGECGAGVTCPNDCGAQGLCTASNACVSIACKADPDCTQPSRSHCKGGGATATGVCVQCTAGTQCKSGEKCASDACVPVCTAATAAADCPAATPRCKESPTGNACVQCLTNANCSGATPVCSTTNTCIPTPPTGCTSDASCPAGAKKCDTSQSPAKCVQCLSTADCTGGDVCDLPTKTCKPLPVGSEGNPCRVDFTCDAGNLCVDEGGAQPVCRKLCDPNAAGNPCTSVNAGYVCEWYGFDASNAFFGFCEPKNGHAVLGAACDPRVADSCEWNLFCAPRLATTGVCATLCKPGAACSTGACNAIVGALSSAGAALQLGYCGTASKWGKACITDTASGAAAPGVPDCGDPLTLGGNGGLFCTPSTLPAEVPAVNVAAVCLYTPAAATATGGANDSCVQRGGNDCRTGVCLNGPTTCYAGCQYNADCTRDGGTYCFDVEFSTANGASTLGSCEPTCRVDSDCPSTGAGRSCQPQPTYGGNSWQAVCGTVAGAGKAGAKCTSGADCGSGTCFTASTLQGIAFGSGVAGFSATDGFCLGSCTGATDCTGAGTSCRIDAALPLAPLDTGDQGVMGKPNPGICFGTTCSTDANCAGFSADATTPRVCAPYKVAKTASTDNKKCTADSDCAGSTSWQPLCNLAANNPNPGGVYGANAGFWGPNGRCRALTWAMQCAPSLGKAKGGPGAACTAATDCKTGHCVNLGTKNYCFGGCALDTDCAAGTVCRTGNYLGLPDKHCAP